MTSNLGSDLIKRETSLGFSIKSDEAQTAESSYERMKEKVMDEVKRFFRPEFLNRIDATIVFHQLSRPEILSIVDLMMKQVSGELSDKQIQLEVTDKAREHLGEKGFDPVRGARPLRRLIQDEVEDLLSEDLLSGRIHDGDTVIIDFEDDKIVSRTKDKEAAEEPSEEPTEEPTEEPAEVSV